MSSASVKMILSGLEPRKEGDQKSTDKTVIDSYVPKASGVGIVDRIKNRYPKNSTTKNFL